MHTSCFSAPGVQSCWHACLQPSLWCSAYRRAPSTRRAFRFVVHAEDPPALASRPTLRPPPQPQQRGPPRSRKDLDQQRQQQQQPDANGGSDRRSGGPQGRDQLQDRPQHRQQRPSNGAAPPMNGRPRPAPGSTSTATPPAAPPRLTDSRGRPIRRRDGVSTDGDGPPRRKRTQLSGGKRTDVRSRRETRGTRRRDRAIAREAAAPVRQDVFEVGDEGMPVMELATTLAVTPSEIVKILFMKGIMVQVNQVLDRDAVHMVVDDFEDVEIIDREAAALEDWARKTTDFVDEEDLDHLVTRPPVVTIMGHVDHGKTSLLDFVRKAKVAAGEAGGITQAIGAYTVEVPHDGNMSAITFLDTPGHEAFSAMRARGTKVTDIAIIVVAADDGVRPQTQEAISHARAAGVPIVVALNKIDKEGAEPERVKQELAELQLLPEEWGGQTAVVPISAKFGQGVDDLLETILLQAEVEELLSNPEKAAKGTVIEAHLDRRRGPVATLLVQAGTLRIGDMVVASGSYGKVRSLAESTGEVQSATPSLAVQMVGLNSVPTAGDEFYVCEDETMARKAAEVAEDAQRMDRLAASAGGGNIVTTKSWASMDDDTETVHRLNVILKADASGTVEAVKSALGALPQDSVLLRFLLAAPNNITTSDIDLAAASEALVVGFNAEPSEEVMAAAKEKGVTLRTYNVIYDLVDDVRAAMEGRLNTVEERTQIGEAEVRAVFGTGNRIVAGCMVNEGLLRKGSMVVVNRGKRVLYEGKLTSLRRVKDDVKEVSKGLECGVRVDGFASWRDGDRLTAFQVDDKRRTLEEAAAAQPESSASGSFSFDEDDQ